MPYISQEARHRLNGGSLPETAGELNYAITRAVDRYLVGRGRLSYANLNEVVGVLQCVQLELYRRVAAPYEDHKIAASGDVYDILET